MGLLLRLPCAWLYTNSLRGITRHLNYSVLHSTQEELPVKAAGTHGMEFEMCAAQPAADASPCSPPASTAAQECSQVKFCIKITSDTSLSCVAQTGGLGKFCRSLTWHANLCHYKQQSHLKRSVLLGGLPSINTRRDH